MPGDGSYFPPDGLSDPRYANPQGADQWSTERNGVYGQAPGDLTAPFKPIVPWQPGVKESDLPPVQPRAFGNGTVEIPTLNLGLVADPNHTDLFKTTDPRAQVYFNARDSIVRIVTTTPDGKKAGSGFFVTADGKIATDYHVVRDGTKITVETADGGKYDATIADRRPTEDLAVLTVQPQRGHQFHALPLAPSADGMNIGDPVYVVGHPRGWQGIYLSSGQFSGYGKRDGIVIGAPELNPEATTLSAVIHAEPGNSGSPMLNAKGQVVGLVDWGDDSTIKTRNGMTTVDDLHEMLGDRPSPPLHDYIVPSGLDVNGTGIRSGLAFGLRAGGLYPLLKGGVDSGLGKTFGTVMGGINLWRDSKFLGAAFDSGTTAEKVDAGIDVAADAMMVSGIVGTFVPEWRLATGLLQLGGAGIRLVNSLMSNRKY